MEDCKVMEYAIRLYKNDERVFSEDLLKSDALIFIKAAEHLIRYLTETIEERT